jgi:hypothetical protein
MSGRSAPSRRPWMIYWSSHWLMRLEASRLVRASTTFPSCCRTLAYAAAWPEAGSPRALRSGRPLARAPATPTPPSVPRGAARPQWRTWPAVQQVEHRDRRPAAAGMTGSRMDRRRPVPAPSECPRIAHTWGLARPLHRPVRPPTWDRYQGFPMRCRSREGPRGGAYERG